MLLHGATEPYLLKNDIDALRAPKTPPLLPEIAGPDLVEPIDPALKAALDHAFEEPDEPPFRRTRAVVVVHDGKVIAERYATGVGVDTPLLGFSMTKSVINALIGVLTQQGLVTPSMPAPIPEWRGAKDPRREIEVEHLMRMTTGLELDETNSGFDSASRMLYLHDDMAGFAVKAPMIARPARAGIIPARPRNCWRGLSAMPSAVRSRRSPSPGANCSIRSACATSRWNSTASAPCRAPT